ncbi:hypothetical protein R0G64_32795, partial [Pseudomonas otitidis]
DFLPVERVLQIGTAKGIARLMQRAGRSGHAPGRTSRDSEAWCRAISPAQSGRASSRAWYQSSAWERVLV